MRRTTTCCATNRRRPSSVAKSSPTARRLLLEWHAGRCHLALAAPPARDDFRQRVDVLEDGDRHDPVVCCDAAGTSRMSRMIVRTAIGGAARPNEPLHRFHHVVARALLEVGVVSVPARFRAGFQLQAARRSGCVQGDSGHAPGVVSRRPIAIEAIFMTIDALISLRQRRPLPRIRGQELGDVHGFPHDFSQGAALRVQRATKYG